MHRGIYAFLNVALLHVLILPHARTSVDARTNTRPYDRITNVLRRCVQDLTTREGDLLVLFVRSVAVISRVPRRGRPAGSHLPPTLPLPVPAEEPRGGRCNRFPPSPTEPDVTCSPGRGHRTFPHRSLGVFPLEFKNE